MTTKNYIPLVLLLLILASACNKKEDDPVTQQTISGMVYNQCTDSGLANVQVYLKINKDNSTFQSIETVSGTNGTFSFANVDMHSNSKYTYAIYIPSKSGIGGGEIGFNGTTLSFNYNEATIFFKPRVTPKLQNLCFQITPSVYINYPDTIVISFQQKIFHKNIPDLPYQSQRTTSQLQNSTQDCTFGNYPMGLWNIAIDKWKGGVHTTTQDSIYLGWGATKTYTVNW